METLIAAYVAAWALVSAYVVGMAVRHRRLAQRLNELEALYQERGEDRPTQARAA